MAAAALKPQALLRRNVLTVDQLTDLGGILVEEFVALEDLCRVLSAEFGSRFDGMLRMGATFLRWGGLDVSELMLLSCVKEGALEYRDALDSYPASGALVSGSRYFVVLLLGSAGVGLGSTMLDAMLRYGLDTRDARHVERVTADLDRFGVDPQLSARKALVVLRDAGYGTSDSLVRVAQRLRSEAAFAARRAGDLPPPSLSGNDDEF